MHIVTKILVVAAAILCVLLAALTMAYAANADAVVRDNARLRQEVSTANTQASGQVSRANEEKQVVMQKNADLSNQLAQLEGQVRQLQSERATLQTEKSRAESERDSIKNQIGSLGATSDTQARLIENYRNEVSKLRDNELGWKRREIELNDRLSDLESQREVLEGSVRALQEQLAEARRQIEQGGAAAASASSGPREPFSPTFAITGRVTRVQTDMATGKPVATINVGSSNQIRENMKLAIVRGDKFVANIVVKRVDLQWALGEIDYLGQGGGTVQEGDVVRSLAAR